MKKDLITERHIKWLKDNLNLSFDEIEQMTDEQDNVLCNNLLMLECDALEADSDEIGIINEIQDIIYDEEPPYDKSSFHLCPVCGQYKFECMGSDDICEVCAWQDDIVQELNPDEECGENQMSLNQAREAWKNGIPIE